MHLLVGKPALEALVRDIDVEAETHFMTFCKIFWQDFLVSEDTRPKPISWLFAKYFGFLQHVSTFWSERSRLSRPEPILWLFATMHNTAPSKRCKLCP